MDFIIAIIWSDAPVNVNLNCRVRRTFASPFVMSNPCLETATLSLAAFGHIGTGLRPRPAQHRAGLGQSAAVRLNHDRLGFAGGIACGGECANSAEGARGLGGPAGGRPIRRAGAGGLAEPAGQGDRALSAGRRRRHGQPHPVPEARRDVGPVVRHRQPRRRRRHDRRGGGGQVRSGRLYGALRRHRLLGEPGALSEALVRLRQGLPAGVPGLAGAEHPGGDAVGAGEDASPTSSRSRRRRRAGSTSPRPATARCSISASNCSAAASVPRSITSPIAAAGSRSTTWSRAR